MKECFITDKCVKSALTVDQQSFMKLQNVATKIHLAIHGTYPTVDQKFILTRNFPMPMNIMCALLFNLFILLALFEMICKPTVLLNKAELRELLPRTCTTHA